MNNYQQIKKEALNFVQAAFDGAPIKYPYHNWGHTQCVQQAALEIMEGSSNISEEEKQRVEIAAIFHDVGFVKSREEHEELGAAMAEKFLQERDAAPEEIEEVKKFILATKMSHAPENNLEGTIQDADLAHIGKKRYASVYNNLYEEVKQFHNPNLDYISWKKMCLDFFEEHKYNTTYAKKNFAPIKEQNKNKIMALKNDTLPVVKTKDKKKSKTKSDIPEKGIETMFRVSLRNHTNLSRIADNKANTLISVNAIIVSIVLSTLFPKLDNNPYLIYPGISLLAVNMTTIIVAILSVIPKTTHGIISREQVSNKKGNLLFFGNFHRMSIEDFEWGIDEIMHDKEYLYKTLTRDLFYLGKVLNRKYMFLRLGYYIFIIGLVISIGLFMYHLQSQSLWG